MIKKLGLGLTFASTAILFAGTVSSKPINNFTGTYKCDGGKLAIIQIGKRLGFIVYRRGGGIRGDHIAIAQGWTKLKDNTVKYKEGECKLSIKFEKKTALVEVLSKNAEADCMFGAGASIDGTYKLASRKKPNMKKIADSVLADTSIWTLPKK